MTATATGLVPNFSSRVWLDIPHGSCWRWGWPSSSMSTLPETCPAAPVDRVALREFVRLWTMWNDWQCTIIGRGEDPLSGPNTCLSGYTSSDD